MLLRLAALVASGAAHWLTRSFDAFVWALSYVNSFISCSYRGGVENMIGVGVVRGGGFSESSFRGLRNGPTGSGRVVFPPDPEAGFVAGEYADNGE